MSEELRRERIDELLGEKRLPGAMESTWEYHGVRCVAALTLAVLEMADALTDIAAVLDKARDGGAA